MTDNLSIVDFRFCKATDLGEGNKSDFKTTTCLVRNSTP